MKIRLKTRVTIGAGTLRGAWRKRLQATSVVLIACWIGSAAAILRADPLYWDGPTSSSWNTTAPWDTAADGAGGDPGAFPAAADIATFNVSSLITPAQTVLIPNTTVAAQGLDFPTSVAVTIQGAGGNSAGLVLGTSGITKTGDFVSTIGSETSGSRLNIKLDGNQTWQNNSTVNTAILAIVGGQVAISPLTATPTTLTLDGTNTGANVVSSAITDAAGGGVVSIVKNGPGSWALLPRLGLSNSANTFTGNVTVNEGILGIGLTGALGTGNTVILNGGMLTGHAANITSTPIPNAIHVTSNAAIRPSSMDGTGVRNLAFSGTLTSTGSPGMGPTLTIGTSLATTNLSLTLNGDMSGFNGRILLNQLAADTTANHGTSLLFQGTTAEALDGSKAIFEINGPGPANNPTLGVSGGVRVRIGFNATATTTKMGELRGSGAIGGGNAAGGNHTLEIGHLNTSSTFSGDIMQFTGAGLVMEVKKVGTGSLTLSGNSDYLGVTTVSNGTLVVGADAGIAKFQPTDAVGLVAVASNVITAPASHGLADGDRIVPYSGLALVDIPTIAHKPLYVKVLSPTTYELYTDSGLTNLQTFTDDASFSVTMPTALGSNTGAVVLGDSSANATLLAGTASNQSVTIARGITSGGSGVNTFGSDQNGNSVYSGTITLNNSATVTSASTGGNELLVSGQVTGSGGLTKTGSGLATLTNSANNYAGNTTVAQGILSLTDDFLADAANVLIAGGAILDLDYSGTDIIESLYLNGVPQAPGLYGATGLGSSFFTGLGLLDVQTLGPTIGPIPGDFNSDGDVDGDDFATWQMNFPTSSGAFLIDGDADGDGDVDGADFVVWQTNFPYPSGSVNPVPEPNAIWLAAIALVSLGAFRLRKQV